MFTFYSTTPLRILLSNNLLFFPKELAELNIPFYIISGQPKNNVADLVKLNDIGCVVCDFSPLRIGLQWCQDVKLRLPSHVLFTQVDAHNLVPCWHNATKLENGAMTIRPKLAAKLDEFLTEHPPVVAAAEPPQPLKVDGMACFNSVDECYAVLECDKSVDKVDWAVPGYRGGINALQDFIDDQHRCRIYDVLRNDPNYNAQSGLSPWLHFGQMSAQRCAFEVQKHVRTYAEGAQWFMEAVLIRRDLADNYCYYEKNYDTMEGAPAWGRESLRRHARDKRPHLYRLEEFERSRTHDNLWNACQNQLLLQGKIHGYMRMYWAKKILEWTETPEQALEFCIYLNDKYSLDGRDPNGYVGAQSSITGLHDKNFDERPILGGVRGLSYQGCRGKFDVDLFVKTWVTDVAKKRGSVSSSSVDQNNNSR
jgi:deoxyribodipyrimidine photo-lyase